MVTKADLPNGEEKCYKKDSLICRDLACNVSENNKKDIFARV
jgi:hypothetical protein